MATPQVFVSHSHTDNDYCRVFVAALRQALGDDDAVWYDEHNLGWGALRQVIDRELQRRHHFIAILSPAAVASNWVNREIDAALALLDNGSMQTIQFVISASCQVSPLLQGYKRIEQADGVPYPPQNAARKAQAIITGRSTDSPLPSPSPPADILPTLGPAPAPANSAPAHHLTPMPLYTLGFRGYSIGGVECILPPICPVPEGVFIMGSDKSRDPEADDDEMPQYPVDVDAFAIGQHPVTVAEYACAVRANAVREPPGKSSFSGDRIIMGREPPNVSAFPEAGWTQQQAYPDHPIVAVSWNDAVAYTCWLAKMTGHRWRLPSEAEWEKAARWMDGRIYPWGDSFDKTRCNTDVSGIGITTPVGRYPNGESPYYAQDMAGNVWEWTSSLYMDHPYRNNDGRESLDAIDVRVLRGGSWGSGSAWRARAAYRNYYAPTFLNLGIGFRLALDVADSK